MTELNHAVFLWFNLDGGTPKIWLDLARFASLTLPQWLVVATLAVAFAGAAPARQTAWRALLSCAAAAAAAYALKPLFHWQRPFVLGLGTRWVEHAADPTFPSSHACVFAALAVALLLAPGRGPRGWLLKALALAAALLISWSRMALGLHFPLDVLGGWCIGLLVALAVQQAWTRLARRGSGA